MAKVCGHLTITPICESFPNCSILLETHNSIRMVLYALSLKFPFSETQRSGSNLFQHDYAPVHKASSVKPWSDYHVWIGRTLSVLHKALTTTPVNIFWVLIFELLSVFFLCLHGFPVDSSK